MKYEEFTKYFTEITIGGMANSTNGNQKISDEIKNIEKLVNIFTKLRQHYENDDEHLVYELSLRDAQNIFDMYNGGKKFQEAVMESLIIKAQSVVSHQEDKKEQKEIVEQIINREFHQ